jgi:2-dehydropantoate 2-reductase
MKILVLGAGAIGSYIGGRLTEAGADITFLVRNARKSQLDDNGLILHSVFGNLRTAVTTTSVDELIPLYNLVILTCKAYDLESSMHDVAPALAPNAIVLPILNGLGHIETLNQFYGQEKILGGTIKLSAERLSNGTIKHLNDWHWLHFGEQEGGPSDRVTEVLKVFDTTVGLEAISSENIMQEMWEKFVHLCTAASMTCLMRANSGQIISTNEGTDLFLHMLETTSEVAKANGHPPSKKFIDSYRTLFSDPESKYVTSMLRDIETGNCTEGKQIIGLMLEHARKFNINSTLLSAAYTHIQAYEIRRENKGAL